jgi:hypothetical protein
VGLEKDIDVDLVDAPRGSLENRPTMISSRVDHLRSGLEDLAEHFKYRNQE